MSRRLTCPSARTEFEGSEVIGIVLPSEDHGRQIQFLPHPVPVTDEMRAIPQALPFSEFLRVAAPCADSKCANFEDGACAVASSVRGTEPMVADLPPCHVRGTCRWFRQEGREICFRCPAVVTDTLMQRDDSID